MSNEEIEVIPWVCRNKKCGRVLGYVKRINRIRRLFISSNGDSKILITGLAEIECICGSIRVWDYGEEALKEFAKQRGVELPDPLVELKDHL